MRVALLTTFAESCGIAAYSEALVPELRRAGAAVEVLAPRLPSFDTPRGPEPRRLWNRDRAFGLEALRVVRAVREARARVVHAQVNPSLYSSRFLFTLAAALRALGIPLVATLHGRRGGSWGRDLKVRRMLFALRHADLIVHSASHAGELGRERVHVIPHGAAAAAAARPLADARAAIGLDPARRVIAHFGFLVPDKGIADVLRAVAELRRSGVPDLFYWIAGAIHGTDESRRHAAELRRLIGALGLGDAVHLDGEFAPDERVDLALQAADWVVLNYRTGNAQGASGAAHRAIASGRPVAVSAAAVFDEVREATFPLRPPLAASIAAALSDAALVRTLQERARRYCEERSWPRTAERHLRVYERALSR